MKLQTANETRNEIIPEFAHRKRPLTQKILCKLNDPVAERIYYENADWMFLASFVAGLTGIPVRQLRFPNHLSLDQEMETALSVQEAEKHKTFSESLYTSFDNSFRIRSPSPAWHPDHVSHTVADARHSATQVRRQRTNHVVTTNQKHLEVGKPRLNLHLYVMSVRELDTSRESVLHG